MSFYFVLELFDIKTPKLMFSPKSFTFIILKNHIILEVDIAITWQKDFLWNHTTAGSLLIACALNV